MWSDTQVLIDTLYREPIVLGGVILFPVAAAITVPALLPLTSPPSSSLTSYYLILTIPVVTTSTLGVNTYRISISIIQRHPDRLYRY